MNLELKYDQALEVIVGLSNDIQELKEIITDRTNDIILQQKEIEQLNSIIETKDVQIGCLEHEIHRLKSDAKFFADESNYGSLVFQNADLLKFQETTKRVVGDFIFALILEEMENE